MSQDELTKAFQKLNALIENSEMPMSRNAAVQADALPEITRQDLSGKVVIVTGSNVGIGFETAKSIAAMKPRKLILACRNPEKATAAAESIKAASGLAAVETWQLDLASFASVRAFAKKFAESGELLDLLVSNAGISLNDWVETEDGLEITIQVNHLANMLLILLLTPAVSKAQGRIVVVASNVHFWAPLTPEDPHPLQTTLTKPAGPFLGLLQYFNSKLFNILFTKTYASRCPYPVTIFSANPGYTESQLGQKDAVTGEPKEAHRPSDAIKIRSTYDGAKTIIASAITPEVTPNGAYFSEMKESDTRKSVQGEVGKKFADTLWRESVAVLKQRAGVDKFEDWVEK